MLRSYMRYCPGCASALLVMVPFGICYLCYIAQHFDIPTYYWWAPIVAFPLVGVLMILSPVLICKNRNTRYGFAEYEATAFSVKNGIAKLRR